MDFSFQVENRYFVFFTYLVSSLSSKIQRNNSLKSNSEQQKKHLFQTKRSNDFVQNFFRRQKIRKLGIRTIAHRGKFHPGQGQGLRQGQGQFQGWGGQTDNCAQGKLFPVRVSFGVRGNFLRGQLFQNQEAHRFFATGRNLSFKFQ